MRSQGWRSWFRLRREIPRRVSFGLTLFSFCLALGLYIWRSQTALGNPEQETFFPTLQRITAGALEILSDEDGQLWEDIALSIQRVFLGFSLAAVVALPIGIMMGAYRVCEAFFQPLIEFIRYIPVPALIPLLVAIYGVNEEPKVALIFIGTFFQLVLMIADEIRRVSPDLIKIAHTLGANPLEVLFRVLFRAALPGIFDVLRICHGWAWTYVVVAELIATNSGMGIRIMKLARFIQMPKVMVYLLILGSIGLSLDWVFRYLNQRLFFWAESSQR